MGDIKQVFGWVTRNPRQGVAIALFVAFAPLGWVTAGYFIAQAGNASPELALPYNLYRVGTAAIFGMLGASLVWGKA